MLQFDSRWRYDSPGPIEPAVVRGFRELIDRICGQGQRKSVLEHFKSSFVAAAGVAYYASSDES